MKKIKFITLIILFSKIAYSQTDSTYYYVLNEHIEKSDSSPVLGIEFEFNTNRKYFKSFLFSETRLFTGSNAKSVQYKIENCIWYYKQKNKWRLFYDYNKMEGGYITFNDIKYRVKFKKVVIIRNVPLHKIVLEPMSISQSHKAQYYFSPSKGVLLIKANNGIILLRKDSFKTSLSDDEYDSL